MSVCIEAETSNLQLQLFSKYFSFYLSTETNMIKHTLYLPGEKTKQNIILIL